MLSLFALASFASANSMNGDYPPPANALPGYKPEHRGDYFEMISNPVTYRYSEVYWTAQAGIPLPAHIVKKFANRTISFTGFEVDVVRKNATGDYVSVPAFETYNHHYCCTIIGNSSKMTAMGPLKRHSHLLGEKEPRSLPSDPDPNSTIPTAHNFWQGNGGEYRKSFKHIPAGFGQLVDSPTEWHLQPMLINTKNPAGGRGGPEPRSSTSLPGSNYSGLLECPCTTRTVKVYSKYNTRSSGTCGNATVLDANECFISALSLWNTTRNETVSTPNYPSGCVVLATQTGFEAYFNNYSSKLECGTGKGLVRSVGSEQAETYLALDLDQHTGNATITFTGPANLWFGVGFGAANMAGLPYAIIVDGNGNVTERKLANHDQGMQLPNTIDVISQTVTPGAGKMKLGDHWGLPFVEVQVDTREECAKHCDDKPWCQAWTFVASHLQPPAHYNLIPATCKLRQGLVNEKDGQKGFTNSGENMWSGEKATPMRTIVMKRKLAGSDSRYYTFDPTISGIPFINAVGTTPDFQYHGPTRMSDTLMMLEVGRPNCLCRGDTSTGSINGVVFDANCMPWPQSSVLRDHNPTCSLDTYQGGLSCCSHGTILLDADQEVPGEPDTVYMKFRFYYEDPADDPEYQNAFFLFRDTEHAKGEHDTVKCPEGTPPEKCIFTLIGNFQVKDAMKECESRSDVWCAPSKGPYPQSQYIQFLHISPHCHTPDCISMEMINADTNETICKIEPIYGENDDLMNEAGYVNGIPPCIWGYKEKGLRKPPIVSLDTNITVIKKANATSAHYGQMGHWQMRAAWYMK